MGIRILNVLSIQKVKRFGFWVLNSSLVKCVLCSSKIFCLHTESKIGNICPDFRHLKWQRIKHSKIELNVCSWFRQICFLCDSFQIPSAFLWDCFVSWQHNKIWRFAHAQFLIHSFSYCKKILSMLLSVKHQLIFTFESRNRCKYSGGSNTIHADPSI